MKINTQHNLASKNRTINLKKLLNVAALGAFIAVPVLGSAITSDAAPRRDNNHGWGNNNRGRGNNRGRDNNRGWGNNQRNEYRTFIGTVLDIRNNRFNVRVNGVILNVLPAGRLPGKLDRGDNVRIYGVRDGNRIINANVNVINRR